MISWKMFFHSNPVNFYCTLSFTVQHQLPRHRGDSFKGRSQGKFKSVDHGHLCDCGVMSKEILCSTRIRPAIWFSYFEYCKAPIFHCRFLLWYPAKRFLPRDSRYRYTTILTLQGDALSFFNHYRQRPLNN